MKKDGCKVADWFHFRIRRMKRPWKKRIKNKWTYNKKTKKMKCWTWALVLVQKYKQAPWPNSVYVQCATGSQHSFGHTRMCWIFSRFKQKHTDVSIDEVWNSKEFYANLFMNMWAWMSFFKFICPHLLSKVWKSTCLHCVWMCVFGGGGCRVKMRLLWEEWSAKALRFIKSCRSRLPACLPLSLFLSHSFCTIVAIPPSLCIHCGGILNFSLWTQL